MRDSQEGATEEAARGREARVQGSAHSEGGTEDDGKAGGATKRGWVRGAGEREVDPPLGGECAPPSPCTRTNITPNLRRELRVRPESSPRRDVA